MKKTAIFLLFIMSVLTTDVMAQKRPPKEKDKQTRENAVDIKEEQRRQKESQYLEHREKIEDLQTKETKKRMKKNLKKAQKHSQGKSVPWHKRLFRKRKF
ncbi:MAG: hypothetical protein ACK4WD_10345 [Flavobacteriales bacterium]|jgi:predicted Holliday junction resolvase-like endonuclease